ncbi:hypothetical protein KI387_027480, partial [Taxus chinensis]
MPRAGKGFHRDRFFGLSSQRLASLINRCNSFNPSTAVNGPSQSTILVLLHDWPLPSTRAPHFCFFYLLLGSRKSDGDDKLQSITSVVSFHDHPKRKRKRKRRKDMDVTVTNSVVVKPASETPQHQLWLSNLDFFTQRHTVTAYIYSADSHFNVCVLQTLKEALSKVLVYFYPLAGRLIFDAAGRIAVDCNGDGVVFVEAVTDSQVDDLKDLGSTSQLEPFIPAVNHSDGLLTAIPPLILQVTRFKCGGIALGLKISHILVDGTSALHFVKTWCDIARGSDVRLPPIIDRSALRARNPPQPSFVHHEYAPPPSFIDREKTKQEVSFERFTLSKDQVNSLKEKALDKHTQKPYTTFEALAAHVWKCCCAARDLSEKQKSKLYIAVDARNRLVPSLPS